MIQLAAFIDHEDGWGRHARSLASALSAYERTELLNWGAPERTGIKGRMQEWRRRLSHDSVGIGLGALEKTRFLRTRYRVAFFVWETTLVPASALAHLQSADMIWTPSSWGRELLHAHGISPEKVRVAPEGVDIDLFKPPPGGRRNGTVFRFLCVGKWEERKGTADLVRAFLQEFSPAEPVELVMHCGAPWARACDFRTEIARLIGQAGVARPRIASSDPVGLPQLVDLMQSCHAFVLPTRGEAWGLPVLEAMACELPCIVTDWSGIREYANEDNCYPIPVQRMRKVDDPEFYDPRYDWGEWAQPDLARLRRLMRFVYENQEQAMRRGRRARQDAERYWTWQRAAQIAMGHLKELRARPTR